MQKRKKPAKPARRRRSHVDMKKVNAAIARGPGELRYLPLGEDPQVSDVGLVDVQFTAEEEKILGEKVKPADVQVKTNGELFLSHIFYTRWFNRAFGRAGWAIVPRSKAKRLLAGTSVHYVLTVHGKPIAHALGEQENEDGRLTANEAEEATVASALRRCAKRLGVGLELWDRRWVQQFLETRCVRVWVKVRGQREAQYRLMVDNPLPGEFMEFNVQDEDQVKAAERQERPAGHNTKGSEPITKQQLGRLFKIQKAAGRSDAEVKAWLTRKHKLDSRTKISRDLYDAVCSAIEKPGPLRS